MTSDWLADLQLDVTEASTRMRSAVVGVVARRDAARAAVEHALRRVDTAAAARARARPADRHAAIMDAVRRRQFHTLTIRDQRYAAQQFRDLSAADMQDFLQACPRNWPSYAAACFRDWEKFRAAPDPDRAAHERLLCIAPRTVAFLYVLARPQHLVVEAGPTTVATRAEGTDLAQVREWMARCGLDPTWGFSSLALARWVAHRLDGPLPFRTIWSELGRDLDAETMLLPPRGRDRQSWFSDAPRPARIRSGVMARATLVAGLLRSAFRVAADPEAWGGFIEVVLNSEFGDPRVPPESAGWSCLRKLDEATYRGFLSMLTADDLKVFFQYAMSDGARELFWLCYLRSIRRTTCVLDRETHERLTRHFAGADKGLAAAISRARQFRRNSAGVQAFCLYFDHHVIVEFSDTGNAAWIYERASFERLMQGEIDANRCLDHNHLKQRGLLLDRIIHQPGWENRAANRLYELKIFPD